MATRNHASRTDVAQGADNHATDTQGADASRDAALQDATRDYGARSDIRGVLIQTRDARLLLPNATIAEVLSYAAPEAVDGAPDWLLGRIRWRGWQVPLASFPRLAGIAREEAGLGSKVVVLKALAGDTRAPYFALLTQGFPRLVTVSRAAVLADADQSGLPAAVLARVTLKDDDALVPDLALVETRIREVMGKAG